jgi:hypothetical protein
MRITITENQFHLLEMFANTNECEQIIEKVLQPLEKLKKCLFTSDGKYVVYEGKAYNAINGNEVPINEEWTLSDILHTGADVLSMGMDFVIPGSGAVVDVLNALSYIIEAQFKSDAEKDSLYLMAAITFAFVVLPGPLQAIATPLKRAVKTGAGFASKTVVKGLKIIGGILDTLLLKLPSKINAALKSPLAKNILGKYAGKISGFFKSFSERIKSILGKLTGKTGKEGVEKAGKEGVEKAVKQVGGDAFQKTFTISKECVSASFCNTKKILQNLMGIIPSSTKFNPSKVKVLSKSNVAGREVIEVELENGGKTLFYKSSGANQATTGKAAGEWVAIPGFAENGWFVKTTESINLVKGGNQYLTSMSQFLSKNGTEGLGKTVTKTAGKTAGKTVGKTAAKASLNKMSKLSLTNFFKSGSKISKGKFVLRKMGFVVGKPYRYVGKSGKATTATITEITDNGVKVAFKNGTTTMVPIETFMKNAVGAPWLRRGYSVLVPFFIKRLSDVMLSDGSIDYAKLEKLPDLNPDETSQESLLYLEEEVASYEGETGEYNVNDNAKIVQQSLMKLGYPLPRFKDDGKFGPETLGALKKFQQDNGLTSSVGKLDRLTSKKLAELLKSKNIVGSEELQSSLNSM